MDDHLGIGERPEIVTERLTLRMPRIGDADRIVAIVGDWEVARRLSRVPHPCGPAYADFFLEHVVLSEWVWAITERDGDEMIGAVGLTPNDDGVTAELGYWPSPSHWARGIVTEAADAVVRFGLDTLALSLITSGFVEENTASGRVLEKLGFRETGRGTRPCLATGGDMPSVELSLSAPTPSPADATAAPTVVTVHQAHLPSVT